MTGREQAEQRAFLAGFAAGYDAAGGNLQGDPSGVLDRALDALEAFAERVRAVRCSTRGGSCCARRLRRPARRHPRGNDVP